MDSVVYLGNFEVEKQWARGERSLPRVHDPNGAAVVNRMDEFALLLGGRRDHVLLKAAPDPSYLDYLAGLGLDLPTVHVPRVQDPRRCVTEDVLDDPALLAALSGLATEGCRLVAHGVSEVEELLAAKSGLPLAAPDAATCKSVNSKAYGRRVADDLGLRQPPGWACSTEEELATAMTGAAALVRSGRKVAVKEAFGVSGKGIAVVDNERRLDRLGRLLARAEGRPSFVVEAWVDKTTDLNYQFTVSRDGAVRFDFVKEAVTESGVHKGHRMPARLTEDQTGELHTAARLLGERLAADGYFGIVGVDAMVDPHGGLYPVTEINARHNMSTYQVPLQDRFVGQHTPATARHYPLRLAAPLPFEAVRRTLAGLMLERPGDNGLLVNNFATVNAAAGQGPFTGRLYGLLVADREDELATLDETITTQLSTLEES